MGVALDPVLATDAVAIDTYHSICAAARAHDVPDFPPLTRDQVAGQMLHPSPFKDWYWFIVRRGADAVGAVELGLPTADNRHVVTLDLFVHPQWRRQGVGRETFAAVIRFAREHGRTMLLGEYCVGLESGPRGARRRRRSPRP